MKTHLILLGLLTFLGFSQALHSNERDERLKYVDQFASDFLYEYLNYTQTGQRTNKLNQMFQLAKLPHSLVQAQQFNEVPPEDALVSCIVCRSSLAILLALYRNSVDPNHQAVKDEAINLCMQFTDFGIEVCTGVVELNAPIFFYILNERPQLTANGMCSMVNPNECTDLDPMFNFAINVSPGQPITGPKTESVPRNPNELRVLHISDPHYDPVS